MTPKPGEWTDEREDLRPEIRKRSWVFRPHEWSAELQSCTLLYPEVSRAYYLSLYVLCLIRRNDYPYVLLIDGWKERLLTRRDEVTVCCVLCCAVLPTMHLKTGLLTALALAGALLIRTVYKIIASRRRFRQLIAAGMVRSAPLGSASRILSCERCLHVLTTRISPYHNHTRSSGVTWTSSRR